MSDTAANRDNVVPQSEQTRKSKLLKNCFFNYMNLEVFCSDQQVAKKIMKIFPLKFENKLQSCYILESLRCRIVTHIG